MNNAQLFQLKWNNHSSNILQEFLQNFLNEQLVDVTLSCRGQMIKVHKLILSACSPYFETLFRLHQQKDIVIIINSISMHHLQLLVEFMYTGEIKIMEKDLQEFLEAAGELQIKSLYDVLQKKKALENQNNANEEVKINMDVDINNCEIDHAGDSDSIASTEFISMNIPQNTRVTDKPKTSSSGIKTTEMASTEIKEKTNLTEKVLEEDSCNEKNLELEEAKNYTKTKDKIRRPPNAFMIFANQWRRKLACQYAGEKNKEISIRLGYIWRNLSSEEKAGYYEESRRVDEEHKRKYPGYFYNPVEARKRKLEKGKENRTEQVTPGKSIHYESCDSADDARYESASEYKPDMSDVINAVIGMGVRNCIIENNNVVTKAEIEPNLRIKTDETKTT